MSEDAYVVCRYVRHYHAKNGFAPKRSMLGCSEAFVDLLEKNGVITLRAIYGDGPMLDVFLTDKGLRMAEGRH